MLSDPAKNNERPSKPCSPSNSPRACEEALQPLFLSSHAVSAGIGGLIFESGDGSFPRPGAIAEIDLADGQIQFPVRNHPWISQLHGQQEHQEQKI